jgi:CRISPR system Cascade subunit CasC
MKLVEIHLLQTVAPSNLNRDDTNSPKDAMFGGYRRARVSSQAQKRAARVAFRDFLPEENLGVRTRLLKSELVDRLKKQGRDEEKAGVAVEAALGSAGFGVKDDGRTEYLLFLGRSEIDRLADLIDENFDSLSAQQQKGKAKGRNVPAELERALGSIFDGGKAVDVALFGRMLADKPKLNQDAAAQVAHAISTHKVDREFDFYTAVDDLAPEEETGAGMMGDVEFYSATLYRYATLDLDKLVENLHDDKDLALRGALAFLRSFISTLPSGKQNTFAAHNPPVFIALRAGKGLPRNLATAFERPVYPREKSLSGHSAEALMAEWKKFDDAFGSLEDEQTAIVNLTDGKIDYLKESSKGKIEDILRVAEEAIRKMLEIKEE